MSQLFDALTDLKNDISRQQQRINYAGLFIGKVAYTRDSDKHIRVVPVEQPTTYVTWWLKPSTSVSQYDVQINDFVIFGFPTLDPQQGIYFDVFNKAFDVSNITREYIQDVLDAYDEAIKEYIESLDYQTVPGVAAQISSALTNYVTTSALNSTLANYVTTASLYGDATHCVNHTAAQNLDLPTWWTRKRISVIHSSKPFPYPGATQDATNPLTYLINSVNNPVFATGSKIRLLIMTSARIVIQTQNGITLDGASNFASLLGMGTQWELTKISANAWTSTNIGLNA